MNRALVVALAISLMLMLFGCRMGNETPTSGTATSREVYESAHSTDPTQPLEEKSAAAAQDTPAPIFSATIQIHLATDEYVSRFASVHEFMEFDDDGYQKIVLTTDTTIHDFKFIDITGGDFEAFYDADSILFSAAVLTPEKPFVVTWMSWGALPHRGISYVDADHTQKYLCISENGEDGSLLLIEPIASEQGVPEAYEPILDALLHLEESMHLDEYGEGEGLETVGFAEYPYPRDSALGYALTDLNGDGVSELLLGTVDGLNDSVPNSVFTLKDGQPVLLASFWSRSRGVIASDGSIYSVGSGGASSTYLASYVLEENADALTQLTDMYSDYSPTEGETHFIQLMHGESHYITEQEFSHFYEMYDNPPDTLALTVIPIVPQR